MAKYIRPTPDTKFHIDFAWWQEKGENLRAYLQSHVCPACEALVEESQDQTFDWVNPETGEVFQIDMLWHIIHTHCSQDPAFFDSRTPLTSAIFRTFLFNGNTPLTSTEIHYKVSNKTPELILRTIGRRKVYKGIKPVNTSV
jgi:hypothetical protein